MKSKIIVFFTIVATIYCSSCEKYNGHNSHKCFMSENYDVERLTNELIGNWKLIEKYNPWEDSKVKFDRRVRLHIHSDYTYRVVSKEKLLDQGSWGVNINIFNNYPNAYFVSDGSVIDPLGSFLDDNTAYVRGYVTLCKSKELLIDHSDADGFAHLYKKIK